eukprot:3031134-Prymnesium_polylepis.2
MYATLPSLCGNGPNSSPDAIGYEPTCSGTLADSSELQIALVQSASVYVTHTNVGTGCAEGTHVARK